ncbi:MAG: hypothetical protein WBP93_18370 [Pyrinomonadaceae bacterium]
MLNIDTDRLQQVTQEAFDKAQGQKRWQTAIVKAKQIIESNPFVHMSEDGTLLMLSDSDEIYEVKHGSCPCKAFANGQPCKHRATRQLLLRYSATVH